MADAYCGPSNALQTFQKHTSADRTLQQDRLTQRRSPLESFRSQDPNAGLLDPEFEAFQASQPGPLAFGEPPAAAQFQSFNQRGKQPVFGGLSNGADWAADFQRLQVSSPGPQMQQMNSPAQRGSPAMMTQPASSIPAQSAYMPPRFNQSQYSGYGSYGSFNSMGQSYMHEPQQSQAPPQMQQEVDMFDEVAFERAFDMAKEQIMEEEATSTAEVQRGMDHSEYLHLPYLRIAMFTQLMDPTEENMHKFARNFSLLERHDPALIDFTQWRLFNVLVDVLRYEPTLPFSARYNLGERADALMKSWEIVPRETPPESILERTNRAAAFYSEHTTARKFPLPGTVDYTRTVTDNEMVYDIEQQVSKVTLENVAKEADVYDPSAIKTLREEEKSVVDLEYSLMLAAANSTGRKLLVHTRMERYFQNASLPMPLDQLNPEYIREFVIQEPESRQPLEDQSRDQDNDDLARTAGELLDKVQDNQSTKFQNSTFLDLMRRLRDREVRVEGDKMVETNLNALDEGMPAAMPALRPVQRPVQLDGVSPLLQSSQGSNNDILAQQLRDGEDVVRMLDEPSDLDQDPEFMMMTMPRPFYDNQHAELGRRGLFNE